MSRVGRSLYTPLLDIFPRHFASWPARKAWLSEKKEQVVQQRGRAFAAIRYFQCISRWMRPREDRKIIIVVVITINRIRRILNSFPSCAIAGKWGSKRALKRSCTFRHFSSLQCWSFSALKMGAIVGALNPPAFSQEGVTKEKRKKSVTREHTHCQVTT